MPIATQTAVDYALTQTVVFSEFELQVTKDTPSLLVDKVREYFNINNIPYEAFSYDDLIPYLPS